MVKRQGYFQHDCDLPVSAETCLREGPPYLSKYKKCFHSMKKLIQLDETSMRSKRFFRSYAAVAAEKSRHADGKYSKIIHPFSRFAVYKERILCILWLITFFVDPIRWAFFLSCTDIHPLFDIQIALDAVFLLNVLISCFTGYCVPLTKEIILSPKIIIKKNMLTYLLPETLASLPYKQFVIYVLKADPKSSRLPSLGAIRLFRWFRLIDTKLYLTNMLQEMNFSESVTTIIIVFLLALYLIHWSTCGLCFVSLIYYTWDGLPVNSWLAGYNDASSKENLYEILCSGYTSEFCNYFLTVFIRATSHFFGASEGYRPISLNIEKLACVCVLMMGFWYTKYAEAKVLQLFGSVNISESKYEELTYQVSEYVRSKNLTDRLKRRIHLYYEYKFHKKFFKEDEILATLSEHLRHEVCLHSCKNVLERLPLFHGMSKGVIGSIIPFLEREIYLPNDVVIRYGDPLTKMFWVSCGTLAAYYGENSVEIIHFEDGDHFGDYAITKRGGASLISVVVLEITEIFTIARKDVKHCTTFLKEMGEKVSRIGKEKALLYATLAKMMEGQETEHRVIAELRKGRILEKERYRKKKTNAVLKSSSTFRKF